MAERYSSHSYAPPPPSSARYSIPPTSSSPGTVRGENGSGDESNDTVFSKLKHRHHPPTSRERSISREAAGANIRRLSTETSTSRDRGELLWENGGTADEITAAALRKERRRADRDRRENGERERIIEESERERSREERREEKRALKAKGKSERKNEKRRGRPEGMSLVTTDGGGIRISDPTPTSYHPTPVDVPAPSAYPEAKRQAPTVSQAVPPAHHARTKSTPSPVQQHGPHVRKHSTPPPAYQTSEPTPPHSPPDVKKLASSSRDTSPVVAKALASASKPATPVANMRKPIPSAAATKAAVRKSEPSSPTMEKKKIEPKAEVVKSEPPAYQSRYPPPPEGPPPPPPTQRAAEPTGGTGPARRPSIAAKPAVLTAAPLLPPRQSTPPSKSTGPTQRISDPLPRISDPIPIVPTDAAIRSGSPVTIIPSHSPVSSRPRSPIVVDARRSRSPKISSRHSPAPPSPSEISTDISHITSPLVLAQPKHPVPAPAPNSYFPPIPSFKDTRTRGARPHSFSRPAATYTPIEEDQTTPRPKPHASRRLSEPYPQQPYYPDYGYHPQWPPYGYGYDAYHYPHELERGNPFMYPEPTPRSRHRRRRSEVPRGLNREYYEGSGAADKARGEESMESEGENGFYSGVSDGWTTRSASRDVSRDREAAEENVEDEEPDLSLVKDRREKEQLKRDLVKRERERSLQREQLQEIQQKEIQQRKGVATPIERDSEVAVTTSSEESSSEEEDEEEEVKTLAQTVPRKSPESIPALASNADVLKTSTPTVSTPDMLKTSSSTRTLSNADIPKPPKPTVSNADIMKAPTSAVPNAPIPGTFSPTVSNAVVQRTSSPTISKAAVSMPALPPASNAPVPVTTAAPMKAPVLETPRAPRAVRASPATPASTRIPLFPDPASQMMALLASQVPIPPTPATGGPAPQLPSSVASPARPTSIPIPPPRVPADPRPQLLASALPLMTPASIPIPPTPMPAGQLAALLASQVPLPPSPAPVSQLIASQIPIPPTPAQEGPASELLPAEIPIPPTPAQAGPVSQLLAWERPASRPASVPVLPRPTPVGQAAALLASEIPIPPSPALEVTILPSPSQAAALPTLFESEIPAPSSPAPAVFPPSPVAEAVQPASEYPFPAASMAPTPTPNLQVYRRFTALNRRILLTMQNEISELEAALSRLDDAPESDFAASPSRTDQQLELLNVIAQKLAIYNQAVKSYQETFTIPFATSEDITDFCAQTKAREPSTDIEFLSDPNDLMLLGKPAPTRSARTIKSPVDQASADPSELPAWHQLIPPALPQVFMQMIMIIALLLLLFTSSPPPVAPPAMCSMGPMGPMAPVEEIAFSWSRFLLKTVLWGLALLPAVFKGGEENEWVVGAVKVVGLACGLGVLALS